VAGIDDDNATGTLTVGSAGKELLSFVSLDLLTPNIVYSDLEPGDTMANLTSSSTIRALGNTGLNQALGGDSMCIGYTPNNPCVVSPTSTIPQSEQRYATTSVAYASGFILQPTSTPATFDIRIPKATLPLSPEEGTTFWGIAVPASISISGEYTGQNIFIGVVSPATTW